MSILEVIKKRRSIRQFQEKKIPPAIIEQLIEALIWAPSAGNLQSRKFYFVFNPKIKEKLAEAALGQDFIAQAPLVIVGCADGRIELHYGKRGRDLYTLCDVSTSLENLFLVAEEKGLGGVWVGAFEEEQVAKILELPKYLRPLALIPLGYPTKKPSAPARVSKEEAVEFIR